MTEYPLHPYCEMVPWMTPREMDLLVASIKDRGLIMPVVLTRSGQVLDGKCRLRACELAGVEPRFETFDGDDEACKAFVISMNVDRVHLSPSQVEIGLAIAQDPMALPEARLVAARHPQLAQSVMSGATSLGDAAARAAAYEKQAEHRLAQAEADSRRLEELRQTHGLLAHQVDDGALTLDQAIAAAHVPELAEHAETIRGLGKRMVADAIEIGRRLVICKDLLGHGQWLPWLEREFQWSERTAQNFLRLHELSLKSANIADLDLPLTGLYQLAAPSTPEAVRSDVLSRAEAGEQFSLDQVRRMINAARPDRPKQDGLANLINKLAEKLPDDPLIDQLRMLAGCR